MGTFFAKIVNKLTAFKPFTNTAKVGASESSIN